MLKSKYADYLPCVGLAGLGSDYEFVSSLQNHGTFCQKINLPCVGLADVSWLETKNLLVQCKIMAHSVKRFLVNR